MFEILVMVKTSNVVEDKAEIVMEIMTRAEVSLGRDLWNAIFATRRVTLRKIVMP